MKIVNNIVRFFNNVFYFLINALCCTRTLILKYLGSKFNLYLALFISIMTYSFWTFLPKESFYKGNALYLLLISGYIFSKERKSLITFIIFELTISYFFKEMFLNPKELYLIEALLIIIIPVIWYRKYGKHN